ncbi:MAG: hydrogenase nickel incorporation protein HypB [Caldilineaceae bacterium]
MARLIPSFAVEIGRSLLAAYEPAAGDVRARLAAANVTAVNLMASPGAGKTTLVLATAQALATSASGEARRCRLGVIEGDLATRIDADRIAAQGIPVVQINTAGGCHLDAPMIGAALDNLPIASLDLLLIENVGNLVCPAHFDLGARAAVVLGSVPEGDDKPRKYPGIYAVADAVVVTKFDLAPLLDFDMDAFVQGVRLVNPDAPIIALSARTGVGVSEWLTWLMTLRAGGRA